MTGSVVSNRGASPFLAVSLTLALAGCGSDENYQYAASEEAAEQARSEVYEQYGADAEGEGADPSMIEAEAVEDSASYSCTDDCSGHEAGVAWAADNDVTDESECGGDSESFREGCESFAADRQQAADEQAQQEAEEAASDAETAYDSEY